MHIQASPLHGTRKATHAHAWMRIVPALLICASLSACPLTETRKTPEAPPPVPVAVVHEHAQELLASYADYALGRYDEALTTLDSVLDDALSSPTARRNAYLARALIHVNGDRKVHDVVAARAALQSAAALEAQAGTDALASYFANAVDQVLDGQQHLQRSQARARQLGRDKASLEAQNQQLTADKATLNAALEKLKRVTLGN